MKKMGRKLELSGKRFGRLTVIRENGKKNGRTAWLCKCDCGNEIIAKKIYVMRGEVKSCGCISIAKEGSSEELEIKNYILSLNKNIKIEKNKRNS